MSYYGYNIDPEELEKEKRKEREKREKEREKSQNNENVEKNNDNQIEDSKLFVEEIYKNDEINNIENDLGSDKETSQLETGNDEDEYIDIDCSQCTQDPSNCDKNCLDNLKEEYIQFLIKEHKINENEETTTEDKDLLEEAKKKALCLEPGILEKLKKDLPEEDFKFIKTDMIWYTGIFFTTFFVGLFLFTISIKFNIQILPSVSILILLAQNITNIVWKGRFWNYIRSCLKNKKNPIPYESILKEIPKYRTNALEIPMKKRYVVFFITGVVASISLLIKDFVL